MSILITSITPADKDGLPIGNAITNIVPPAVYKWGKKDISSVGAGRTQAMNMLKMRKGKVRTLDLEWKGKSYATIAQALTPFDYEYILMTYMDALLGTLKTGHFYMGDMSANSYTATNGGIWEVASVSCIQATPDPG